jgi:hypothetical protein
MTFHTYTFSNSGYVHRLTDTVVGATPDTTASLDGVSTILHDFPVLYPEVLYAP